MSDNRILATTDDEIGIGRWGREWQRFMTENYPDEAAALQSSERWEQLALEIEKEAMDLRSFCGRNTRKQIRVLLMTLLK